MRNIEDMKSIKNTAVLVAVSHNDKPTKGIIPFTIATLINENGLFELPNCDVNGETDIKSQALEAFQRVVDIEDANPVTVNQLKQIGSYSFDRESHLEITNAFMFFIDGKPAIHKNEGDKTPAWVNIDAFDHQALLGNQNDIISDVKDILLEAALSPTDNSIVCESTKKAIIKKYFPIDEKYRIPWINRLQESGINIHEHLHPGVAIDLVIFGYRNTSGGNHDELSVLLTYRKNDDSLSEDIKDPWAGTWSLPGTFLKHKNANDPDKYPDLETVREAAVRIAKEKAGIDINPDEIFYETRPFVHTSRMGGILRDGSPVITLPVFIPIEYTKVNENTSSLTTNGCKWFTIKRELWSTNGKDGVALRGGDNPLRAKGDGTYEVVTDVMDDNSQIETWRTEDIASLRSSEEIGLPAADVFIQDDKLVIKYYQTLIRPHTPIQDRFYEKPQGVTLMTADHANIILSALQTVSESVSKTLHIVSKLLNGGTFKPIKIIRMLSTWWFPWSFSRSNMHKKLIANGLIIPMPEEKAKDPKSRNASYKFVEENKIDDILRYIKPL